MNLLFCNGACQKQRPKYLFWENHLAQCRLANDESLYRCAHCAFMEVLPTLETTPFIQCKECKSEKPMSGFGARDIKQGYFDNATKRGYGNWHCLDCKFPRGTFKDANGVVCGLRPEEPPPHNVKEHLCDRHRWPPCACGAPRTPRSSKYRWPEMPSWTCTTCKEKANALDASLSETFTDGGRAVHTHTLHTHARALAKSILCTATLVLSPTRRRSGSPPD